MILENKKNLSNSVRDSSLNRANGLKILNISLDQKVLEQDSAVQKRILEYGELVEKYTVIVLADKNDTFNLSENIKLISVNKKNKVLGFLRLKLIVWKTLKKEKYDLITVQDVYFIGFLALQMARIFKVGLEIQVHGFEKFKGIRKVLAKFVLLRANSIRAVSQRLKKQLIYDFEVKEDKITVVPVYINFHPWGERHPPGENRDKFIFLTVGRLVSVKNIEMQIKAIANLKDRFKNIELWIVGDGEISEKLKVESRKLGLDNIVKFLGYQDDLDKFYQQADVFLLTSDSEGYGMVIIEAASYGLPIIMTDVGCAGEFIKDRENGIIIPIKDQKALEERMEELIEDQELRIKLRNNAKDSVKNLITKEETLNLYKQSWEKAIKK